MTADARVAMPLAVTLAGLARAHPDNSVEVYICFRRFPQALRDKTASAGSGKLEIHWLDLNDYDFSGLQIPKDYDTVLLPLLIPERLPEGDRILYLDSDLLIREPLTELWLFPLGDSAIAAVRDEHLPTFGVKTAVEPWVKLGLSPDSAYFNSGVYLANLETWREERVAEKALALIGCHRFAHPDQTALNICFADRWQELHPRWNVFPGTIEQYSSTPKPKATSDKLREATESPAIVHFAGPRKPWHWSFGRLPSFSQEWFELLAQTEWRGFRPRFGSAALKRWSVSLVRTAKAAVFPSPR